MPHHNERETMCRIEEVLQEARKVSLGGSELVKEKTACGYLAQWVFQLEQDLVETEDKLAVEKQRRIEARDRIERCLERTMS